MPNLLTMFLYLSLILSLTVIQICLNRSANQSSIFLFIIFISKSMLIIVIDLEFEYSGGCRSTTCLADDEIGFYFKSLIEKIADSSVKRVYVMVYRWDAANY